MNPFHHHIHTRSREVSLSEAERARMRRVVGAYMRMHPLRAPRERLSLLSPLSLLFSRHALAFVLIGAVLTSSAGVSYAAESALPGDALYELKTKVSEPLRGAFASSPRQKAEWAMRVADERAKEAATLAAEQKLDDEKRRTIEDNFRTHATIAAASIEQATEGDPLESAQAATRFEARLSEYERVIVALDKPDTHTSLASAIRSEREMFAKVRARAEERAGDSDDDSFRRAAVASLADARDHIRAAHAAFASSTEETIVAQLEAASSTIAVSDTDTTSRDEVRASVRKTLRDAEKLRAFAETSRAIHARTGLTIERDEAPKRLVKARTVPPATTASTVADPALARGVASESTDAAVMMTAMPAAETETPAALSAPEQMPTTYEEDREEDEREDERRSGRTGDARDRGVILLSLPELDEDEEGDE